jgi:hypothetical protein
MQIMFFLHIVPLFPQTGSSDLPIDKPGTGSSRKLELEGHQRPLVEPVERVKPEAIKLVEP